ncbi:uncharacterized protein LOC112055898 [Bicyclus anynana]|uniref:Uncharacterized protein LOC112055898 n=1 Tax=Bicyclus anynana TaxID=110368 RepID=A0A6J1NWE1_BICAN|nr:uncharacterized protein LOC112055898 [Bicyclus anynana]XP_023951966.2 uncharacterized protein LOC112055898 [Bicyclus anynana]
MHEQDGDGEPAHHARRPMNAFLIFCKRHRSVVRDKYPNLENRSITKILGEWWANLDKEEKACYTGLAKQYKDAFFSANPDFKWYKLPAPPLRTLSSRPREPSDRPDNADNADNADNEPERTNNNSTKHDYNKRLGDDDTDEDTKPAMFTPGKLADEAQMGSLSSLLSENKTEVPHTPNPYYSPPSYKFTISTPIEYRSHIQKPKEHSISELQNALTETTRVFEEEFEVKRAYRYNDFTNQDVIDQIVDKRYSKEEERNWSDDDKRSGRSCKGKRYQEFMAVGGLIVNKRQRRDCPERLSDEGYGCDAGSSREEPSPDRSKSDYVDTSAEIEPKIDAISPEPDNNGNKTFKAADFDLDAKIRALPSLSLEKFQQRKRDNKRKKKTVLKPQTLEPSQIINCVPRSLADERREMAESWRDNVIGSQKRKPRKISITRLEINSMVSSDVNGGHKTSPEIKIATEAPCTVQSMDMCTPTPHSVDMLALATLAEVASNKSRMEDFESTAKASDYASKV